MLFLEDLLSFEINSQLGNKLWDRVREYCDILKFISGEQTSIFNAFRGIIKDLLTGEGIKYLIETGIIEEVIEISFRLISQNFFISNEENLKEDFNIFNVDDNSLFEIFLILIKDIDYADKEFNQTVAQKFYDTIGMLNVEWETNYHNKGFANIVLFRIFGCWILRYLFMNLAFQKDINLSSRFEFKKRVKEICKELFFKQSEEEIEQLMLIVIKFTARAIGFKDEIESKKWKIFEKAYQFIPNLMHSNKEYDLPMLQIALLLSPNSDLFLNAFLEGYSIDGHLRSLFLESTTDTQKEESKESKPASTVSEDLSENQKSNLKLLINRLNSLMINNSYAVLLWRNYEEKVDHKYKEKVTHIIEKAFTPLLKYELINALDIKEGRSIQFLKSLMNPQFQNSSDFLSVLHKLSTYSISPDGSQLFNLKPKYLSYRNVFR
jgi:hypothetical protein